MRAHNIPQKERLDKLFIIQNKRNKQLKTTQYKKNGKFPIIGQSSDFICGYSDNHNLVRNDIPVIVFGDHTKVVKFIDFPFIAGADGIQILKPIPGIDINYLYYVILNAAAKMGDYGYSRHLKYLKESIVDYTLDMKKQIKLTQVLVTLDKQLIQNNLPAVYRTIREGMLQDLFTRGIDVNTGKLRPSYNEAPELYKSSILGNIPKNWQCKVLKIVIEQTIDNRGKTPPVVNSHGIELVETISINNVELAPDYSKVTKFVTHSTFKHGFRHYLEKNDILISTVGEYAGSTAILTEKRGAIAQNLVGLRVTAKNSPYYVFYWFKTEFFIKAIRQVLMNSAQPSLNVSNLLNFSIQCPPLEEQLLIAERLKAIDNLILSETNMLCKLSKLKEGLMNSLF